MAHCAEPLRRTIPVSLLEHDHVESRSRQSNSHDAPKPSRRRVTRTAGTSGFKWDISGYSALSNTTNIAHRR